MAPTLGITCDFLTHTNSRGMDIARHAATFELVDRLACCGARVVLLPHLQLSQQHLTTIDHLDGLVISGGDFDVPPALYGEAPHPRLGRLVAARTQTELRLLALCAQARLPTLGLCGGMQLINVWRKGSLHQDLSLRAGTGTHEQPHDTRTPAHKITLRPGSILARWLDTELSEVNSTHHQVLARLGEGLVATAHADDGVVEGIESRDPGHLIVGVQWHPELLDAHAHRRLFACFVDACASR